MSVIPQSLSWVKCLNGSHEAAQLRQSQLSMRTPSTTFIIRMGGGPRTFPGGVSKWQWKRMQAKKAKQLLKARLCRERQIYEMRKRAELRAAVSELEKPWEVIEKAPKLFSVNADDQLKALADRFQRPGGFDMWSDRDGPQLFHPQDGFPSARFFPKGVVHSIKPYAAVSPSTKHLEDSVSDDDVDDNVHISDAHAAGDSSNSQIRPHRGRRRSKNRPTHPSLARQGRGRSEPYARVSSSTKHLEESVSHDDDDVQGSNASAGGNSNNEVRPRRRKISKNRPTYPSLAREGRRSESPRSGGWRRRFPSSKEKQPPPPPYEMSLRPDGRYELRS